MRTLLLVLCCCCSLPLFAQKSICITIDDLPFISQKRETEWIEKQTHKLLLTLQEFGVPAIGFVNERKLENKGEILPERVALLEAWLMAGMELGNHTYSHPDYHRISFEEFKADLRKGEPQTMMLQAQYGQTMTYFRHPFLHTGESPEKQAQLREYLDQAGYTVAPVSMDNSEWIFARAYENAYLASDPNMMEKIGQAYVTYMMEQAAYYEGQAQDLFGREIRHILLIHANLLNADYLDELLAALQEKEYQFISLEDALMDEAYQSEDQYTGRGGISWLHRWALTQEVGKGFFAGEVRCPQFVQEVAEIVE
ncbi:MAG: polysaccharide deacetylase family protein [Bacteroidota bacterium]